MTNDICTYSTQPLILNMYLICIYIHVPNFNTQHFLRTFHKLIFPPNLPEKGHGRVCVCVCVEVVCSHILCTRCLWVLVSVCVCVWFVDWYQIVLTHESSLTTRQGACSTKARLLDDVYCYLLIKCRQWGASKEWIITLFLFDYSIFFKSIYSSSGIF